MLITCVNVSLCRWFFFSQPLIDQMNKDLIGFHWFQHFLSQFHIFKFRKYLQISTKLTYRKTYDFEIVQNAIQFKIENRHNQRHSRNRHRRGLQCHRRHCYENQIPRCPCDRRLNWWPFRSNWYNVLLASHAM